MDNYKLKRFRDLKVLPRNLQSGKVHVFESIKISRYSFLYKGSLFYFKEVFFLFEKLVNPNKLYGSLSCMIVTNMLYFFIWMNQFLK